MRCFLCIIEKSLILVPSSELHRRQQHWTHGGKGVGRCPQDQPNCYWHLDFEYALPLADKIDKNPYRLEKFMFLTDCRASNRYLVVWSYLCTIHHACPTWKVKFVQNFRIVSTTSITLVTFYLTFLQFQNTQSLETWIHTPVQKEPDKIFSLASFSSCPSFHHHPQIYCLYHIKVTLLMRGIYIHICFTL